MIAAAPAASRAKPGVTAVRTIRLCAAPTRRPTTLLDAIARSVAELERSGRPSRTISVRVVAGRATS
jgi:hypothetical protein